MANRPPARSYSRRSLRLGAIYALASYLIYGSMPAYMKALGSVPPDQIMAQRVIWSLVLLALVVTVSRSWGPVVAALRSRRSLLTLLFTSLLIGGNWLLYIWAVLHNHILETSLGFFIIPLATVLLGVAVLREKLRRAQAIAIAIAAVGVIAFALGQGASLWISLVLVVTFSTYGLVRKIAPIDALTGLLIETAMLAPAALLWLWWVGAGGLTAFGRDPWIDLLLVGTGLVTAVPLLLFNAAAKNMPYSLLGPFQYIGPTLQTAQAVLLFGEPFTRIHLFVFGCIWTGLAIFAVDGIRASSRPPDTETAG